MRGSSSDTSLGDNNKNTVYIHPSHRKVGIKQCLKNCKVCPEEEKPDSLQICFNEKKAVATKSERVKCAGRSQENM